MAEITAGQILDLLRVRHADDVFVPECKGGPTWFGGHRRMDVWAMRRSWSRSMVWAYEIKTARGDWLKDDKWRDYLRFCNSFYFVSAPGVIDPRELPREAGLLVVAKTGSRLLTKKKAPAREQEIPDELWRYLLMSRTRIVGGYFGGEPPSARAEWARWLEMKRESRAFGERVARTLSHERTERWAKMEAENYQLKSDNEKLKEIKDVCEGLNINWRNLWDVEKTVRERFAGQNETEARGLRVIINQLQRIADSLDSKNG
jgi:hypothetical protein